MNTAKKTIFERQKTILQKSNLKYKIPHSQTFLKYL
ncbi:MAG: hypothetical protein UR27_C0021G0007 [Candidatus Peregrinibacteria bacterium GW2011_GWA2_33_10]|nr:MAG: hypothetical protein UR27_C0021G0007 [Candidatus Peregrinibacteria bacterium GW2011_GWA2_33_10]KKP41009.1 MAG: hypothetical protein UR30_C0002G0043 [Candidatus Peregrinibacteria bacterium GW2011_GWC2_33_13]